MRPSEYSGLWPVRWAAVPALGQVGSQERARGCAGVWGIHGGLFHSGLPSFNSALNPVAALRFLGMEGMGAYQLTCLWAQFLFPFNLFLAALDLCCCMRAFSSCGEQGLLSRCSGFSLWWLPLLGSKGSRCVGSVIACEPNFFENQVSNHCELKLAMLTSGGTHHLEQATQPEICNGAATLRPPGL